MKKIFLCLLTVCLLTGCWMPYNLSNFTVPNDKEFTEIMETLNTPERICAYMEENFEWELHFLTYSPYRMWLANKTKAGDCNDMSCFAVFVANYHEYETYQIWVFFKHDLISHFLGVFVEDGKYTYSNNQHYHPIYADNFREIVEHYFSYQLKEFKSYRVYDYDNKIVEKGYNK